MTDRARTILDEILTLSNNERDQLLDHLMVIQAEEVADLYNLDDSSRGTGQVEVQLERIRPNTVRNVIWQLAPDRAKEIG
ncbi:hypothetical protein K2X85_19580 [bacterium]|nr:hypothetical protein [bacterium]